MSTDTNIVYRLNAEDEIVYVSESWAEFAAADRRSRASNKDSQQSP